LLESAAAWIVVINELIEQIGVIVRRKYCPVAAGDRAERLTVTHQRHTWRADHVKVGPLIRLSNADSQETGS
jgi:hypothetical protein